MNTYDQADSQEPAGSGIVRETPEVDHATKALITKWQGKILAGKRHWDQTFRAMKWGQRFVKGKQWPGQSENDDRYIANIVQRHVSQRTASLYAKNPKFLYERRKTLDFAVWDGRPESLQEAMMQLAAAQKMMLSPDPMQQMLAQQQLMAPMSLIQDVMGGMERRKLMDRVGATLEILAEHELFEQQPPFKKQMKQLIRRVLACKVGYLKVDFQREMILRPEDQEKVRDYTQQLARLEQLAADQADGEIYECDAEMAELRSMLEQAQGGQEEVVREGLVIDYPQSTRIIPDPRMTQLQGFLGCGWVVHEYSLTNDTIKQVYGVDINSSAPGGSSEDRKTDFSGLVANTSWAFNDSGDGKPESRQAETLVWEVQNKDNGEFFTIADGYGDYLKAPAAPTVKLERFWTIFPLTFNDSEDEEDPFPQSDAELLKHIQIERNRSREGLREHRIAARPATVTRKAALSDEDKESLMNHPAMAVIELDGLGDGDDVGKVLQNLQKPGIDQNLYMTNHLEQDTMMVTGSQEANLGGMSGGTATESSIAESSRMSSVGSNVDDLDDFLEEVARACGHILLANMSKEVVMDVVGPGAVWPQLSAQDMSRDLLLTVKGGSSGRPNRAAEAATFERITPLLLQIPGISPRYLAEHGIRILDDKTNLEDAIIDGLPPISALAKMMGGQTTPNGGGAAEGSDPSQNPANQGGEGGDNAPTADGSQSNTSATLPGAGPDPTAAMAPM